MNGGTDLSLRPSYDAPLPSLEDTSTSRGLAYQAVPPGCRVLDVGCDTGRFGEALRQHKQCIVHGIEPCPAAAEQARQRLDAVFDHPVMDERSFEGLGPYDRVLFLDVLEHLVNPWSVLRGVRGILSPGGMVVVVVPNISHIHVVRRLLRGRFDYTDGGIMDRTHLRWFTRNSLVAALADAGFHDSTVRLVPQIPYVPWRWAQKCLFTLFPDLFAGALVGQGMSPEA